MKLWRCFRYDILAILKLSAIFKYIVIIDIYSIPLTIKWNLIQASKLEQEWNLTNAIKPERKLLDLFSAKNSDSGEMLTHYPTEIRLEVATQEYSSW